jgi:hypothetical protein
MFVASVGGNKQIRQFLNRGLSGESLELSEQDQFPRRSIEPRRINPH